MNKSPQRSPTLSQAKPEYSNSHNFDPPIPATAKQPSVSKTENPKKLCTKTKPQPDRQNAIFMSKVQRSVFTGNKASIRKNLRKAESGNTLSPTGAAFVRTATKRTGRVALSARDRPQQAPFETPFVLQDVSKKKTLESMSNTPFSERGNGVCLDLTPMFFEDSKTVRKCNKFETATSGTSVKKDAPTEVESLVADASTIVLPDKEEWVVMQCKTFSKWLNFTLQPTEDVDHAGDNLGVDVATAGCTEQDTHSGRSPGERAGLRTLIVHQQMAKARVSASALLANEEMKQIKTAIESEMKKGKLAIRADRDMYSDLSQRKKITMLLLSYSTPWLRLALETLFNETILPEVPSQLSPMKMTRCPGDSRRAPTNQLRIAIRNFIVERVLSDAVVLAKYTNGRCKVPSGNFEKRYRAEIRSVVLRRLLVLVFFLDRAKTANILDQYPRLFTKSAVVKSTRDVLISFCRDFLASEGDITKHLGRVGLKAFYKQEPVDEIDFQIANFAVDLRDGIRLTRVAEILTGAAPKALLNALRIPAVSRLQKLHNVGIALGALRKSGVLIPGDVASHHIVDGHRAMVLKLMWVMISHYCFPAVLDFEKVEEEIMFLRQKLRAQQQSRYMVFNDEPSGTQVVSDTSQTGETLLLQWCRAVCALYGIDVLDFSTSFADGKALCYLIHYYHPHILSLDEIRPTTRDATCANQHRHFSIEQLRNNEKRNSRVAHIRLAGLGGIPKMTPTSDTSTVPDEKSMMVYLCYACSRLINSRREIQACLQIQIQYRKHRRRTLEARQSNAAIVILKAWRIRKPTYFENLKKIYAGPVAKIEEFVLLRRKTMRFARAMRLKREENGREATKIQVSAIPLFRSSFQYDVVLTYVATLAPFSSTGPPSLLLCTKARGHAPKSAQDCS